MVCKIMRGINRFELPYILCVCFGVKSYYSKVHISCAEGILQLQKLQYFVLKLHLHTTHILHKVTDRTTQNYTKVQTNLCAHAAHTK